MGWEKRRGQLYYYRKQRGPDGRVRSVYLGRGEAARAASLADGVPVPSELVAQQSVEPVSAPPAVAQHEARGTEPEIDWRRYMMPKEPRYRYRK